MATISDDRTVKIWNISIISNWVLVRKYEGHTGGVYGLEYINADTIASGSLDFTIQIWSISTGFTNMSINTGSSVRSLCLLTNVFRLAAGLQNGNINVYDIRNGDNLFNLNKHTNMVECLALINDELLASSSVYTTIIVWNLRELINSLSFGTNFFKLLMEKL